MLFVFDKPTRHRCHSTSDMSRRDAAKPIPPPDLLAFERQAYQRGCRRIAGVDEAGRGPLAGPVVAAAVVLPSEWIESDWPHALAGLNDSKQLTEAQRERFFVSLTTHPQVRCAIASSDALEVDRFNILRATHQAMNTALEKLEPPPDHVLVDGRAVPTLRFPQTALVKGDARSYSIAAASVLAKVTRDRLMLDFHAAMAAIRVC